MREDLTDVMLEVSAYAAAERGDVQGRLQERLRLAVEVALGGSGCCACGLPMLKRRPGAPPTGMERTRGHDVPRPLAWPGLHRFWLPECESCNTTQGDRTFLEWAVDLAAAGDDRAPRVARAAEEIHTFMMGLEQYRSLARTVGLLRKRPHTRRLTCEPT